MTSPIVRADHSIANVGQGSIKNDIHRIVEIRFFRVFAEWYPFVVAKTLGDFTHWD
jgi:hypothetical protein